MEREPQAGPNADSLFPEMLDLTAGEPDDGEILDLTATVEKLEQAGFLAPESATAPDADDVFDISGEETAAQSGDNGQLLDLTSTADVFNVVESAKAEAESLTRTATGGGLGAAAVEAVGDEIDFDIGDLGDFDLDATNSPLDLGAVQEDDGALDFDISGLAGEANDQEHESTVAMTPSQAGAGSEVVDELDFNLDLPEPESVSLTAAEDESDLQLVTLDDEDGELDFDLSIDDTSSVPDLYLDDTSEVRESKLDTSLRDLSAELEASIAALNGTGDQLVAADLEFDLSAPDFEIGAAESLDLDLTIDRTGEHATAPPTGRTRDEDGHTGAGYHDDDEADSKLNLAKAYIELGESEAARAILVEVTQEGSVNQQDEAGRLLAQIS
jgi:pilus assembly protein FimV